MARLKHVHHFCMCNLAVRGSQNGRFQDFDNGMLSGRSGNEGIFQKFSQKLVARSVFETKILVESSQCTEWLSIFGVKQVIAIAYQTTKNVRTFGKELFFPSVSAEGCVDGTSYARLKPGGDLQHLEADWILEIRIRWFFWKNWAFRIPRISSNFFVILEESSFHISFGQEDHHSSLWLCRLIDTSPGGNRPGIARPWAKSLAWRFVINNLWEWQLGFFPTFKTDVPVPVMFIVTVWKKNILKGTCNLGKPCWVGKSTVLLQSTASEWYSSRTMGILDIQKYTDISDIIYFINHDQDIWNEFGAEFLQWAQCVCFMFLIFIQKEWSFSTK